MGMIADMKTYIVNKLEALDVGGDTPLNGRVYEYVKEDTHFPAAIVFLSNSSSSEDDITSNRLLRRNYEFTVKIMYEVSRNAYGPVDGEDDLMEILDVAIDAFDQDPMADALDVGRCKLLLPFNVQLGWADETYKIRQGSFNLAFWVERDRFN